MAKVYGTWRSWKNASGHSRACRLSLTYSTSQTSDTFTLTYKIGYDIEWVGAIDMIIAGTRKDNIGYSSTFEFKTIKSSSSGSITGHEGAAYTLTYSKGTTPKSVTFTVKSTNYTNNQDLSVKISFTVPALEQYTITYSTGGISGISNMPSTGYKYYGMTYYMSQIKPTRTNYTFKAWSGKRSSAPLSPTLTLMPGAAYNYNDDLTATATWTENTYTISYNNNGGSGTINSTTYGAATTSSVTLNNGSTFTKTGYNLEAWNTKADGSGVTYQKEEVYTGKTNLTLYAQWTKASYSLSFDEVRPHTPFSGQTQTIEFETLLLDSIEEKIPIDVDVEGNNYYYSYHAFNGWYNLTDNKSIESSTTMPGHNITISPIFTLQKDTTHRGVVPNISKVTAIRAQYDGESISSDDTGEGCIFIIEGSPIKPYRFSKNNDYDTGELITPEKVKVIVQIENDNPYEIETNNEFPITINIYNDSSADINKRMLLESSYNISATIVGLIEEDGTTYESSISSSTKSDLLTKAQFTIDISANGDRIGIFQPINDYDENNPTIYPKHMVELNGGMIFNEDNSKYLEINYIPPSGFISGKCQFNFLNGNSYILTNGNQFILGNGDSDNSIINTIDIRKNEILLRSHQDITITSTKNSTITLNPDTIELDSDNTNIVGNLTLSGNLITDGYITSAITACGTTGASDISLSTSEKIINLTSNRARVGSQLTVTSNGVKCGKSGYVEISACIYYTSGFTAQDLVHLIIKKDSTNIINAAHRLAANYDYFSIAPVVYSVSAGDMLYLYAYNQTAARGSVSNTTASWLTVKYL